MDPDNQPNLQPATLPENTPLTVPVDIPAVEKPVNKKGIPAFDLISKFQNSEIHFTNQYTNKYNGGTVKYLQFKVSPAPNLKSI